MNISRHKEQTTKVVTGRLMASLSSRNHHSTVNGILDSYYWNRYYLSYDITVIQWITSHHKKCYDHRLHDRQEQVTS